MRAFVLAVLLATSCSSAPTPSGNGQDEGAAFVGDWSRGWMGERLSIRPDGPGYRLTGRYSDYFLVPDGEGRLRDEEGVLGTITLGSVEFRDQPPMRVARAEFCYEHFVLFAR